MNILGISFGYHDASAALIVDGKIVAASQEERFTRVKHDAEYPSCAVKFCLEKAGLKTVDLDMVLYYENSFLKFDRIIETAVKTGKLEYFQQSFNRWVKNNAFDLHEHIANQLYIDKKKIHLLEHHLAHAASCYYASPFTESAVLILDGVGEFETLTVFKGMREKLQKLESIKLPHSIGLFYAAMTSYLGFEVNEGEYKVMGMAAYGEPIYMEQFRKLITINDEGYFTVNLDYFDFYAPEEKMYTEKLCELFGKAREYDLPFFTESYLVYMPENLSEVEKRELLQKNRHYANIAASLQKITEEAILKNVIRAMKLAGSGNLCLGGGVSLNSSANGKIRSGLQPEGFFIQPAGGDGGSALGAALYGYHNIASQHRKIVFNHAYLGYAASLNEIKEAIRQNRIDRYFELDDKEIFIQRIAGYLANGKIVGWYQNKSEWGPRALGNRSILADPRFEETKLVVNQKIKFREPFRPFAPSVLAEFADEWFEIPSGLTRTDPESFMLTTAKVKESKKEQIRAVVHHDGTARIQLVWEDVNPLYYELIKRFYELTGIPMLLNTSFNLRGEPVVDTPKDAIITFTYSEMDYLAMFPYVIESHGGK